jgi:hypothetical protein
VLAAEITMTVRLETVIKDPRTSRLMALGKPYERFNADEGDVFLNGPVCRRVAILDFEPGTGQLTPPVRFRPPAKGKLIGTYAIPDPEDLYSVEMIKVSAFGTVLKTMKMFESKDTLGRALTWAFDAPQLLVVPRAGKWSNAFYERDSHSLQFFYFDSARPPYPTVFTALSHDIVAHETGHAILDGIAPDLHDAVSPQALALHEAVADLTALLMAFRSDGLRDAVLEETGGSIEDSSDFSGIAPEFASESDPGGRQLYLRNLNNRKSLRPDSGENRVSAVEPHALCEVIGAALYSVMRKIYKAVWDWEARGVEEPVKVSGRALFIASERFKRMILRALDYLPPGEVSFADYGRAILASDQASYPDERDAQQRDWIREEFVKRGIVKVATELDVDTNFDARALLKLDLDTLATGDWAAYDFANRNRSLLSIPPKVSFHVRPRLDVTKLYYVRDDGAEAGATGNGYRKIEVRELIFKVKWDVQEPSGLARGYPSRRKITYGTTLAIDWERKKVRARLTSDGDKKRRDERDEFLRRLIDRGDLKFDGAALGPDGHPLPSVIRAEALDGVMKVRGASRLMHVACCPAFGGDR